MFGNRIASDLRKHFSTVGPSPSPTETNPAATHPVSSPGARLVLLSSGTPTTLESSSARDRWPFLTDLIKISSHRISAFLAEAAVLVLVLGILDRFLASNRLDMHWVGGAFLISTLLLGLSIALELSARVWLSRT